MLQKRPPTMTPAPAQSGQHASGQGPTTGNDSGQTFAIDIVQRVRVMSNEPLTRRKIDAVKKSLGKFGLGAGDHRGCVSDDDGGAGLRVVQTALQVVRADDAKPTASSTSLLHSGAPPRPHSASPDGSMKHRQDQPPKRILFYHAQDPYYGFTNFSPDPVEYQGKRYPTSEHLFQSLKVSERGPAEHPTHCDGSRKLQSPDGLDIRTCVCRVRLYKGVGRNGGDAQMISRPAVHSSSITDPSWGNTYGRALLVRASCSTRPTGLIQRSARTGYASESTW